MPELIERYLAELERRLPGRRRFRRRVVAEASRHLHEAFDEERAIGADEPAAERRAIERFGPARDVAEAFRATLPVRHVTARRIAALVAAGLVAALIATVVQETSTPDAPTPRAQAAAPASASSPGRPSPIAPPESPSTATRIDDFPNTASAIASPRPTIDATKTAPAVLMTQDPSTQGWRRLSDSSLLWVFPTKLEDVAGERAPVRLLTHSAAVVSPNGDRAAVIDGRFQLRVVDLDLRAQHPVALDREVVGPAQVDYQHDRLTTAQPVAWPTSDTVIVLVTTLQAPRNLLRRREILLVDPDHGIRARVPLTGFRALIAHGPSPSGYLLLFRDRRSSSPFILVQINTTGATSTAEIPDRLGAMTRASIPVDFSSNRAFVFGNRGRLAVVDLSTLEFQERTLDVSVTPLWDATLGASGGVVGGRALPVLVDGTGLALLDTVDLSTSRSLASPVVSVDALAATTPDIALVACRSCGDGIRAYRADGTEAWHAVTEEAVMGLQATPRLTLARTRPTPPELGHPDRGRPTHIVLLDTASGKEVRRLAATNPTSIVQILSGS